MNMALGGGREWLCAAAAEASTVQGLDIDAASKRGKMDLQ
jgi:hypothetical protein